MLLANKRLEHALWHCYIYCHSLSKLPGGYDQHKQSLAEHEEKLKEGPLCAQCERDALLKRIAVLDERLKSSTLRNGENEACLKCVGVKRSNYYQYYVSTF